MPIVPTLRRVTPDALRPLARRIYGLRRTWRRLRANLNPRQQREKVFANIYRKGGWAGAGSGPGSIPKWTVELRAGVPRIMTELGATSMLDAPCGDLQWMRDCHLPDGVEYIGVDIVPEVIERNRREHAAPGRTFATKDLTGDDLPRVDVILSRDCLVHLPDRHAREVLENFKRSGSTYLLTTTFTALERNPDIDRPGEWRAMNMTLPPYNFPPALQLLNEGYDEGGGLHSDKCLGLWRLADLPI